MAEGAGHGPLDDSLMTVAEVAVVLRVSNMTVYRLIKAGEMPALRIGKSFRVQRRDLEAYLAAGVVRAEQSNG